MDDKAKIYDRYLKVLALVHGGVEGEKDAAIRQKEKMEKQNPWLIMHHQEMTRPKQQPRQGSSFDWGSVFTAADQIFSTIKDFSDVAYGMQRARLLADQCLITTNETRGSLQVTITIPTEARGLLKRVLTPAQKDAFMETIMQRLYSNLEDDVYSG